MAVFLDAGLLFVGDDAGHATWYHCEAYPMNEDDRPDPEPSDADDDAVVDDPEDDVEAHSVALGERPAGVEDEPAYDDDVVNDWLELRALEESFALELEPWLVGTGVIPPPLEDLLASEPDVEWPGAEQAEAAAALAAPARPARPTADDRQALWEMVPADNGCCHASLLAEVLDDPSPTTLTATRTVVLLEESGSDARLDHGDVDILRAALDRGARVLLAGRPDGTTETVALRLTDIDEQRDQVTLETTTAPSTRYGMALSWLEVAWDDSAGSMVVIGTNAVLLPIVASAQVFSVRNPREERR